MEYEIVPYRLNFKKPAKTSRNVFQERLVNYVFLKKEGTIGIGECAPLSLLSIDDVSDYSEHLHAFASQLTSNGSLNEMDFAHFPSIRFGLETALKDLENGGSRTIFDTSFIQGTPIDINGLVWMGELDAMFDEATTKIEAGFRCIKFKVGAHDFDAECRLLERIRQRYSAFKLEIRLDANGAFNADEAKEQLRELKRFEIHSIEQPIKPNQWDSMGSLCASKLIDIALDEELIGIRVETEGMTLLNEIRPQYLILKPNLVGGFEVCDAWVHLARKHAIGWWVTSALESNIGLNAIAQWVSQYDIELPQGLGTGSLYSNNIESPLQVIGEQLVYTKDDWKLPQSPIH